jgi:hypothetical protein
MDLFKKHGIKLVIALLLAYVSWIVINLYGNILGNTKGFVFWMQAHTVWLRDHVVISIILLWIVWYVFIWFITRKKA